MQRTKKTIPVAVSGAPAEAKVLMVRHGRRRQPMKAFTVQPLRPAQFARMSAVAMAPAPTPPPRPQHDVLGAVAGGTRAFRQVPALVRIGAGMVNGAPAGARAHLTLVSPTEQNVQRLVRNT